jgi:hypothetical protein
MILERIIGSKRKEVRGQSNTDTNLLLYALSIVLRVLGRLIGSKRKEVGDQSNRDTKLPHYVYPEFSCKFLCLLSKYSSQYPVLIHLECTFSFYGKKPNYATL